MTAGAPIGPLLRAFFADHLVQQKAASPQTIHAYRDAFRLLLTFLDQHRRRKPEALTLDDLDAPVIPRSSVPGACVPRFPTACSSGWPTTGTVRATPFVTTPRACGAVPTIRRSTSRSRTRASSRSATRRRACAGALCSSAGPRSGCGSSTRPASCASCPISASCRRRPAPDPASPRHSADRVRYRNAFRLRLPATAGPGARRAPEPGCSPGSPLPTLPTRSPALRGSRPLRCRRSGC